LANITNLLHESANFFGDSQINTPNWLIYAINWLCLPIFILSVGIDQTGGEPTALFREIGVPNNEWPDS
jgi:hypothetical protein